MATIPTSEPSSLVAGDSVIWQRAFPAYPPSAGYSLRYLLRCAQHVITLDSSAVGQVHQISVAPAVSALWVAGEYAYQYYAIKAGERHTLGTGRMIIQPDFVNQPAGFDPRSVARKALADAEAAFAKYTATNGAVSEYWIADRKMKYKDARQIIAAITYWRTQVAREDAQERINQGLSPRNKVQVRF